MTNDLLTSNDYGKLCVFTLLILPPTVFLVGAIPFLFVVFGLFMFRKTRDFDHIETASRNYKIYCWLIVVICACGALYMIAQPADGWGAHYRYENAREFVFFAAVPLFYIVVVNFFFLYPLREHREWIEENGILPSRRIEKSVSVEAKEIDIIKGERLRSFSVADELLKWAKLKEEGHITEQEFNEVRAKLLQKS